MIDTEGFRLGVGIIVANENNDVLWARRIRQTAWQFPQGGLQEGESPEEALYRELYEELGIQESDVTLLGCTQGWLSYFLPPHLRRTYTKPLCIGQKQKWFLLRFTQDENRIQLQVTGSPEFDRWRWVRYWYPIRQVIAFKRHVYRRALEELAFFLPDVLHINRVTKTDLILTAAIDK